MAITPIGPAGTPLIDQVNGRLANQANRIQTGLNNGQLTNDQAQALNQQDAFLSQEEQQMAAANGGHLTGAEYVALNQQLDQESGQIHGQRQAGAAAAAAAANTGAPPTTTSPPGTAPTGTTGPGHVTSDPTNNVITTRDGSTVASDGNGGFVYTDASTGQTTDFSGDPHVYENATNGAGQATFSVQGPFQLQTKDGSVLNVQTSPPDANGATVITGVDVIGPGNHRASMTGINTGQVTTSGVTLDGANYRNELGPSAPQISDRGTINGAVLGGADWTTTDPSDGQRKEITGGDNLGGFSFGNTVDSPVSNAVSAWNNGQYPSAAVAAGGADLANLFTLLSQLGFNPANFTPNNGG